MAEDLRNILFRYSPSTMRDNAKSCHYDNLREHGFDASRAREVATKAAEHQAKCLDPANKAAAQVLRDAETKRSPYRVRFDWEPEEAGIELAPPKT